MTAAAKFNDRSFLYFEPNSGLYHSSNPADLRNCVYSLSSVNFTVGTTLAGCAIRVRG
jgi:hypothetical protein